MTAIENTPPVPHNLLARLPAVAAILSQPELDSLRAITSTSLITRCAQIAVESARQAIMANPESFESTIPTAGELAHRAALLTREHLAPRLMRAVNGAGVILHTGLGRAPLAPAARKALLETAERYSLLALDRVSGKRGDRHLHVEDTLKELTGAEAALVVNNNSAAVLLVLTVFASGRQAIVSRGELVEIGGSFRVPDVMARSGAQMIEVGTTNKTHLRDYETAITPETAIILKVHTSNYRIQGFTSDVPLDRLAPLAAENKLVLLYDQGSGALVDMTRWKLPFEPTVPDAVAAGADVVTCSGDKLIGGPQCGIIVGKRELVERLKRHPLVRALRPDKLTLSALDGTLKLFLDPERLPFTHPIYHMLTEPLPSVAKRAQRVSRAVSQVVGSRCKVELRTGSTEVGSGAMPTQGIPTKLTAVRPQGFSVNQLARNLRLASPPLFTRIEGDQVLIDARTVARDEIPMIAAAFGQALASLPATE